MTQLHSILLVLFFAGLGASYKILAVLPMPMYSHRVLASKLVRELATRNHEVTYVTPFPLKEEIPNLRQVSVKDVIPKLDEIKRNLYSLNDHSLFYSAQYISNMGYYMTELVLANSNMQKVLHSKEVYDLVIIPQFVNEAFLGIAHHFKAPVVLLAPMPLWSWGSFVLSHPAPSSYVPNLLTEYTGHMNFWQRLSNSVYDIFCILYYQWVMIPKHRELVRKYIPDQPDLYQFLNNESLLLINSHVSSYDATPQVPNAIEVGGMHIEEPKTLPEDLQRFLDESTNGVVIFSMGSNLNTSDLSPNKRDALLKAFSKINQNVLWKWEADTFPNQPSNVKLTRWFPQSDVLAHPNVKVFITHGGLFSTLESIYHGVPVVGIPVFSDQKLNMATALNAGYATVVPFQELTEEKITEALQQVLNNPKYKNNALKRSNIMKDRPIKPIDSAIYWIEYVVRHNGATHLSYPGKDLHWYQRNLLDVAAFILAISFVIVYIIYRICRKLCNCRHSKEKIQ